MSGKLLGQADLTTAATNTTIGTPVPANLWWAFTANFCNRTTFLVKIRMALAASATPANAEWVIFDYEMQPNETFDKTGIVLDAGKMVVCQANVANAVSVNLFGLVDPA